MFAPPVDVVALFLAVEVSALEVWGGEAAAAAALAALAARASSACLTKSGVRDNNWNERIKRGFAKA